MSRPSQFRLLFRHFLGRFFKSGHDRGDEAALEKLSGALAALTVVCPIVFFTLLTLYFFACFDVTLMWPLGSHYFGVAMIAAGFMVVAAWDDLLPDDLDQAVLAALPIPWSTLMWAKAAAVGLLMAVGTLALATLTPLVFALYLLPANGTAEQFLRLLGGYLAGACLACLFAFFGCGALRGATLLLPNWRGVRRASHWIQSALAFALVVGFALLPLVSRRLYGLAEGDSGFLLFMPPAWFVGLTQVAVGRTDPVFVHLAILAVAAPLAAGLLFLAALTLGFRRFAVLRQEGTDAYPTTRREGFLVLALNGLVLRDPQARASFWFFVATLWRGSRQRLRLLTYAGASAGWIFVVQAAARDGLNYAAAIAGFLAVAGARSASSAALQVRASWIIRMTETERKGAYLAGVRWGLWITVLAPVFGVLALVLAALGGFPRLSANPLPLLLVHMAFNFLAACLLAEVLAITPERLPFTSLPGPGQFHKPVLFLLGFYVYVNGLATIEALALDALPPYCLACALEAAALAAVIVFRRSARGPFVYQEVRDLMDYGLDGPEED